jgi:hypothetical protein
MSDNLHLLVLNKRIIVESLIDPARSFDDIACGRISKARSVILASFALATLLLRRQHVIPLKGPNLRAATTGIVNCPHCDWSGSLEIKIVERVKLAVRRVPTTPLQP